MIATSAPVSVAVIHESVILRRGLSCSLGDHADLQVDLKVASVDAYRVEASARPPSIVFASLTQGLLLLCRDDAARSDTSPAAAVVVVAASFGELEAHDALVAGARGLLLLDCAASELLVCARTVLRSSRYVAPPLSSLLAEQLLSDALTPRERQVLDLISGGSCNKVIAREMGIAVGTVKTHVKSVLSKLQANSRTQAAAVAVRRGLLRSAHPPRKLYQSATASIDAAPAAPLISA